MIGQMKKLSLIVVSSEAERVMNLLAWLSCAEIEKTAAVGETELLRVTDFSKKRAQVQKSLASLRFAIPYLSPYRSSCVPILRGWAWMSPWIFRERTGPVPFSGRSRRERA